MSTTTMHFGPEWMRTKHQTLPRSHPPPSPPPTSVMPVSGLSTYSALVSPIPPVPSESGDDVHPFRYSKEELLKIYQDGGGKGGLGLEVERWEGVVREGGAEPVTLREMTDAEKKRFAGPLNSELRRRPSQSVEYISPLTASGPDRPRLTHNSITANSPLRERFGVIKRRDSAGGASDTIVPTLPRKSSLSALQTAPPPREAPRGRVSYTPTFDGVLTTGESWATRRRTSEASTKPGSGSFREMIDNQYEVIPSGIREEKEEDSRTGQASNSFSSFSPRIQSEEPHSYVAVANGTGMPSAPSINSLSANGTTDLNTFLGNGNDAGPPPGLINLAEVEWSYKDPTGQVQGPFRADLMQKWYNDGYFSSDLPMKRIRYDSQWTTVAELTQRSNGENIFLSVPLIPNSLGGGDGSPSYNFLSSEHLFNEPFQPAPIRSLRPSTLESYLSSGSLPSDSPSSSVGASHLGNPSPDPASFSGKETKGYFSGDLNGRLPGFIPHERSPSFVDSRTAGLDLQVNQTNNLHSQAFGNYGLERGNDFSGYGYSNAPVPHDSWVMPSNAFASTHKKGIENSFPVSNPPLLSDLGQAQRHTEINGDPLSKLYHHGLIYTNDNLRHIPHSYNFSGPPFQKPLHQQQVSEYVEASAALHSFPSSTAESLHPTPNTSNPPVVPTIPWTNLSDPPASRNTGHAEEVQTAITVSVVPSTSTSHSHWNHNEKPANTSQINVPATLNSIADEGEAWKDETIPSSLTTGNLGQHNQQQELSEKFDIKKPKQSEPSCIPSESISVSDGSIPNLIGKKLNNLPAQNIPTSTPGDTYVTNSGVHKIAWAKEKEGDKKGGLNPSVSLREIQEAEAKKLESRKAAEREKEKMARASASAESKDDIQPFTTSWGLPTSQAGARGTLHVPVRDAPVAPAQTSAATVAVWTTPVKHPATKKTMKEIQEEEVHKRLATNETLLVAPKRAYAESTTKATTALPLPSNGSNVWTTVGPSGKASATVPLPVRTSGPPSVSFPPASTSSAARTSVSPVLRAPTNLPSKLKQPLKHDEVPESPSHDFLKWLSDSLKGLNTSVNVEEIVSMLLSFPLDPDASTIEIISDTIYSNSTTLDGRRFASEFVAKRKVDAVARAKGTSTLGKAPMKPVSIADVVKATPKTAQPEWGFKVVNKKKKGGRT